MSGIWDFVKKPTSFPLIPALSPLVKITYKSNYVLWTFPVSLAQVSEIFPPLFWSILVTSSAVIYNLWLRAQKSKKECYKCCHNRLVLDDCSTNTCLPKRERLEKSSFVVFFPQLSAQFSIKLNWFSFNTLSRWYSWYCCFVPQHWFLTLLLSFWPVEPAGIQPGGKKQQH